VSTANPIARLWAAFAELFAQRQEPREPVVDLRLNSANLPWASREHRMLRSPAGRGVAIAEVVGPWPWLLRLTLTDAPCVLARVDRGRRPAGRGGPDMTPTDRATEWKIVERDRVIKVSGTLAGLALVAARGADRELRGALHSAQDRLGATTAAFALDFWPAAHGGPHDARALLRDRVGAWLALADALAPSDDPAAELIAGFSSVPSPLRKLVAAALAELKPRGDAADAIARLLIESDDRELVVLGASFDPPRWRDELLAELDSMQALGERRRTCELVLLELPPNDAARERIRHAMDRDLGRDRLELIAGVLRRPDLWPRAEALEALPGAVRGARKNESRALLDGLLSGLGAKEREPVLVALLADLGSLHRTLAGRVAFLALGRPSARRNGLLARAAVDSAGGEGRRGPLGLAAAAVVVERLPANALLDAELPGQLATAAGPVVQAALVRMGRGDGDALADALSRRAQREGRPLADELLQVLPRVAPDVARGCLHRLVGVDRSEVLQEVADLLADVGDRTSVPLLREQAEGASRRTRRAVEDAIDRLQVRLGPQAIGGLAVVVEAGGELSMTDGGGLSEVD